MRRALRLAVALALAGSCCCAGRALRLGVQDPVCRDALRRERITYTRREGVFLARGDGSHETKLLDATDLGRAAAAFMPSLSRDGRRLLFLSLSEVDVRNSTGHDLALNLLDLDDDDLIGWRRISLERIVPPDTGGRRDAFTVTAAAWSRDASRIALSLDRPASKGGDYVLLMDALGAPVVAVSLQGRELLRAGSLSWTADSTGLLLGLQGQGEWKDQGVVALLTLPQSGAPALRAPADLAPGQLPALSPSGDLIAAADLEEGRADLVLMSTEGTERGRFTRPAGRAPSRIWWSADARYLYFCSLASTGPLGLRQVTLLRCLDTRTGEVHDLVNLG